MKTTTLLTTFSAFALCLSVHTHAAAESIDGVLEQSGAYSALFTASPQSGDLIGYSFKNNSHVGKKYSPTAYPAWFAKWKKQASAICKTPPR